MIVPIASLNLTPLGKVWGWVREPRFGDGGGVKMSLSWIGWIGGGCSSIEVITFSNPSARKRRVLARERSWRL